MPQTRTTPDPEPRQGAPGDPSEHERAGAETAFLFPDKGIDSGNRSAPIDRHPLACGVDRHLQQPTSTVRADAKAGNRYGTAATASRRAAREQSVAPAAKRRPAHAHAGIDPADAAQQPAAHPS